MSSNPIIVDQLSKTYPIYKRPMDRLLQGLKLSKHPLFTEHQALKPLSFVLNKGETVGIVGRNGSGKSTLLQLLCGTINPTTGSAVVEGRVSALLELGSGFNPEFTGHENIYLNASILGLSRQEIEARYDEILAFSGLQGKINQPVKTYSSGMYVRLAFAIAVSIDPDIFIVDEALAVGDERFQRKCFKRIKAIQQSGATVLFVSHSPRTITEICDRAMLLEEGELLMMAEPKKVISYYHKLLFSPREETEEVKAEIRQYAASGTVLRPSNGSKYDAEEGAHFLADLIPESTEVKGNDTVMFKDIGLFTVMDQQVNMIQHKEEYCLKFTLAFSSSYYGVRTNFRIISDTGVEITGCNTSAQDDVLTEVRAGDCFDISFAFTCLLLPGTYFITINCSGKVHTEEVKTLLARKSDALMFKVQPMKEDNPYAGFVTMETSSKVEPLTTNSNKERRYDVVS